MVHQSINFKNQINYGIDENMWKAKFLTWLCRLNKHFNVAGIGFAPASIRQTGIGIVSKILASDEHLMIEKEGCSFYIHSSPAAIKEYIFDSFEPYTTELFKQSVT